MGERVAFRKLDLAGEIVVVAVVERGDKVSKVTMDSLEPVRPTRAQALWHEAYLEWLESGYF